MQVMKTLGGYMQFAYDNPKMILWSKMGTCLNILDCVSPIAGQELLIRQHSGSLVDHYGEKKMLLML